MTVIYTPHDCDTPRRFASAYHATPAQPSGTIWRCDECGRYWRFRFSKRYPNLDTKWRLVQSWHVLTVFRILRIEARGPEWKMGTSGRPELTY